MLETQDYELIIFAMNIAIKADQDAIRASEILMPTIQKVKQLYATSQQQKDIPIQGQVEQQENADY